MKIINPATEELVGELTEDDKQSIDKKVCWLTQGPIFMEQNRPYQNGRSDFNSSRNC
jgi:hypothetical protein